MSDPTPLPRQGDVFFDVRGRERALRLSRHRDAGVIVLSVWNGGVCQATFRLPESDVPAFIQALTSMHRPSVYAPVQTGDHEAPTVP